MSEAVHPSRKASQPYHAAQAQPWASSLIEAQHEEALYIFGELVLFTLLWRITDFEEGRVPRCPVCYGGASERYAKAFEQPTKRECPSCYGTTFKGGFRAQVIRPALFADRNAESTEQSRGVVTSDTIRFETTGDFTLRKDDYLFRADNTRFQVEEKTEDVPRSGFGVPWGAESAAGSSTAHMEEDTSVAFLVPPVSGSALRSLLGHAGPFLIEDITGTDLISPNGYV